MSLIPLVAPPGLNSDATSFSAAGQYTDGNNVRFREGKPQVCEGGSRPGALPAGGDCLSIYTARIGNSNYVIYGAETKLYATAGLHAQGAATDITPTAFPGAAAAGWAFDAYGSTILAAPAGGSLYGWSGSGVATVVTNAPATMCDMLVTSERQVLALGTNEESGGALNRMCIRGSDTEDYTSAGSWTTSSANNAFEHILEGSGYIVAGRRVGSYVAVWTNSTLYIGQFIGDPSRAYRFDIVDRVAGPTSREAICVIDGVAYWMGADLQLHYWSPGALPGVIPCPISRDLQSNYDAGLADADRMVSVPAYNEIWFFYSDARDFANTPSRYVAYSVSESAAAQRPIWFRGIMARTAVHAGPIVNLMSGNGFTWLAANGSTGYDQGEPATGVTAASSITLGDIYFDNGGRRGMVRTIYPDFSGQVGNVSLSLSVRQRPQSTPVTKGPYALAVGATKKDFRASGMIASFTFSCLANGYFRLGKPVIDVVSMGER